MSNPSPTQAAEYLTHTRQELVRREVRFNSPYKVNSAEIAEGCTRSASDLPASTKEMLLTVFVRATKSMTGTEPPKEYFPVIVDTLAKDLQANMQVMPTMQPKDLAANTIRYGEVALKLKDEFAQIDNGSIVETALRGYMKPREYLAGIQHNYNRLREHFKDENAYPQHVLVHKAFRETHGIGVEAARNTPEERLFNGVRARQAINIAEAQHTEALQNARRAVVRRKGFDPDNQPSAILQTILTNTPEAVDAIRRRVDEQLGHESARSVRNWQDKLHLAQLKAEPKDKGK